MHWIVILEETLRIQSRGIRLSQKFFTGLSQIPSDSRLTLTEESETKLKRGF